MAKFVSVDGKEQESGEMELREHMSATVERTGAKSVEITERFKNARHGTRTAGPFDNFDDFCGYWHEALEVGEDGKLFEGSEEDEGDSGQTIVSTDGQEGEE